MAYCSRLVLVQMLLCLILVNSQESVVEVVQGKDVLLECLYTHKPENVFWRIKSDGVVFDIIARKPVDSPFQLDQFKGRVSSFPEEYSKGNFSIILRNVRQEDAYTYECTSPDRSELKKVQLRVISADKGRSFSKAESEAGAVKACLLNVFLLSAASLLRSCCW